MTKPNGRPCAKCGGPRDGKSIYCAQCSDACMECAAPRTWRAGTLCGTCRRRREMARTPDCTKCGQPRGDSSHQSYCRPCYNAYSKDWDTRNPEKVYAKNRRQDLKTYGITWTEWNAMLIAQNGQCAICAATEPGGRGQFHVDHCHATGRVRALLCHSCNVTLGHVQDSPAKLRQMIDYLERHATS